MDLGDARGLSTVCNLEEPVWLTNLRVYLLIECRKLASGSEMP